VQYSLQNFKLAQSRKRETETKTAKKYSLTALQRAITRFIDHRDKLSNHLKSVQQMQHNGGKQ